jgi:type I restriction enzyme S subunit
VEVRPGYKQTEVGSIPQDWESQTIDKIAFVTSGKRLPLGSTLVNSPTPHPYVRVTDMRPGTVDLAEIKYVPESVFPAIKRYRIYSEDIFISVAGSLGIVGKVPKELDGANLTENADRITSITCSQDFLLHVLMSPLIQNVIDSIQTVGAQPKLALTRIRKFVVPQPPLEEQRVIAAALSDVDGLLAGLDRLIAKKHDLKQAAMQQLLTGQTRLPGFQGEWEVKRLGDSVEHFIGGGTPSRANPTFWGNEVPWVTVKDFATFHPRNTQESITRIGLKNSASHLIPAGTLITSTRMALGKAVIYDVDVAINQDLKAVFFKSSTNVQFAYYWFEHSAKLIDEIGSGSTVKGISLAELRGLPFPKIELAEQSAIATVLSDMDAELTALEARREKTRALKQGMMQELLTGRTRLV